MTSSDRYVRAQLVAAILSIFGGALLLAIRDDIVGVLNVGRLSILIGTLALLLYGVAVLLLLYLRGDISIAPIERFMVKVPGAEIDFRAAEEGRNRKELDDLRATVSKLQQQLSIVHSRDSRAKGDLVGAVADLRRELLPDLAADLEKHYATVIEPASRERLSREHIAIAQARLQSEIGALTRRSNLNLVIGTMTTAFAVGLLTYMVLSTGTAFQTVTDLLAHYIPRVTTVVFIEVFAFFFLKLYKANLAEIKYYQNELTNFCLIEVSLERSANGPPDARTGVLERLAAVDRNQPPAIGQADPSNSSVDLPQLVSQLAKLVSAANSAKK